MILLVFKFIIKVIFSLKQLFLDRDSIATISKTTFDHRTKVPLLDTFNREFSRVSNIYMTFSQHFGSNLS